MEHEGVEPSRAIVRGSPAPGAYPVPPAGVEPALPPSESGVVSVGPQGRSVLPRAPGRSRPCTPERARGFEPRTSAVSATGACCPSRVRTSVSGVRVRHPCRSGPTGIGAPARIRTWTERVLSAPPLPIGHTGAEHPHEESNLDLGVRSAALSPLSYGGLRAAGGHRTRCSRVEAWRVRLVHHDRMSCSAVEL